MGNRLPDKDARTIAQAVSDPPTSKEEEAPPPPPRALYRRVPRAHGHSHARPHCRASTPSSLSGHTGHTATPVSVPNRSFLLPVEDFARVFRRAPSDASYLYEVLSRERPCWAYFDLECPLDGSPEALLHAVANADRVTVAAAKELRRLATETGALMPLESIEVDVITLKCERVGRFSRHVLLKPHVDTPSGQRTPAPLANLAAAKAIARRAKAALDADAAALIDDQVYHHRRSIRLIGQAKLTDPAGARFVVDTLACSPAPPQAERMLFETLIHPVLPGDALGTRLLRANNDGLHIMPTPHPDPTRTPRGPHATTPVTDDTRRGQAVTEQAANLSWHDYLNALNTTSPLLDLLCLTSDSALRSHPHERVRAQGDGMPPIPFERLGRYCAAVLRRHGCASCATDASATVAAVASWQYIAASDPIETVLILYGTPGGVCARLGRAHASRPIRLTVVLTPATSRPAPGQLHGQVWLSGAIWLQCSDSACVTANANGTFRLAKKAEGRVPNDAMPTCNDLAVFEAKALSLRTPPRPPVTNEHCQIADEQADKEQPQALEVAVNALIRSSRPPPSSPRRTCAGDEVCLTQRSMSKQHGGKWEILGGLREPGETPEGTAARETLEEVGVVARPTHAATFVTDMPERGWSHLHLCVSREGDWEGEPQLLDGQLDLAWIPVESFLTTPPPDGHALHSLAPCLRYLARGCSTAEDRHRLDFETWVGTALAVDGGGVDETSSDPVAADLLVALAQEVPAPSAPPSPPSSPPPIPPTPLWSLSHQAWNKLGTEMLRWNTAPETKSHYRLA